MAEIVSLADGVAAVVRDGDTLAMEGFTHLIPFAAGHEVIRQGRRELTLARMTPDVIYDQLIGAGCARRLVFSWGGNPGVGSLHRFRDAVQNQWPVPLEVEEHSHAGMANRYVAGASGLPFAVLRGYVGTDLPSQTDSVRPIVCPFTGEVLTAVPALQPDAAVVHAQRPTGRAMCSCGASSGCTRRPCWPRPVRWSPSRRSWRSWTRGRGRWCCRAGRSAMWPRCPPGPIRPTPMATTSVTTPGIRPGMRSAATATASSGGWRATSWPP